MGQSGYLSLFATPAPARQGPSGVWVSVVLHVLGCAAFYAGARSPRVVPAPVRDAAVPARTLYFLSQPATSGAAAAEGSVGRGEAAAGGGQESASATQVPFDVPTEPRIQQTLVQPELPRTVQMGKMPLPQALLWVPAAVPVTRITPPAPTPVPRIENHPALIPPREKLPNLDIKLSSTAFQTTAPMMPPSDVMPVVIHGGVSVDVIAQTPLKQELDHAPTSVISISEVRLDSGKTTLPELNQVALVPMLGGMQPGPVRSNRPMGSGVSEEAGRGRGQGTGTAAGVGGAAKTVASSSGTSAAAAGLPGNAGQGGRGTAVGSGGPGASVGAATGPGAAAGENSLPGYARVKRPSDGTFGVVVMGSPEADDYPESLNVWKGRLAYTVYVNVGAGRKWLLQYAALTSKQGPAHIDAPWPYDLLVPASSVSSHGAVMVQGILTAEGHLEQLHLILPEEDAEMRVLLKALERWQFRPAKSDGAALPLEVLLIVPEAEE